MSAPPALRIEGLGKTYGGFTALHAIDLSVPVGEFLTIVGPSGSGKTTLIKLLVGMEEQTSGSIWIGERRIDALPANRRPTCMVFQSLALFPHRSVGENIEFPLKIRGVDPAARRARADELLELLRLPLHYHAKRIDACSGGERQRVALARALAFDPEILFFDEPLSALDYRLRKTLEKELKGLHERTGKTFVYITHSLEEAMVMSDRIAILRAGRFEQIGPAEEIYHRPRSRFVAGFMGDVNLFELASTDGEIRASEPALALCPEASTRLAVESGRRNTLMVRPENLRFLADGETAPFSVAGRLGADYLLGSRTQYEIRLPGGTTVVAEGPGGERAPRRGADVRLGFRPEDTHVIVEALA